MTIDVDRYYGVGPSQVGPEHEAAIIISDVFDHEDTGGEDQTLWVCLDCGFVTDDKRRLLLPERYPCDPEKNSVPQSMRERIEERGFPGQ